MGESTPYDRVRYSIVTIAMLVIAFVLPFAYRVDVGPGPDSIQSMLWDYIESSWYSGFRFWNPLETLPYTFMRIIFALLLARTYTRKTTPKKTLLVGIVAEFQPFLISVPLVFLIDWPGDPWVPLYLPIPIMLVLGVFFLLILKHKKNL